MAKPNDTGKWLVLLRTGEVQGLNAGPDGSYPTRFRSFPQSLQENDGTLNYFTIALFHTLYINHSITNSQMA
jgi:hypothetical protein